jgi:hypothetical protein
MNNTTNTTNTTNAISTEELSHPEALDVAAALACADSNQYSLTPTPTPTPAAATTYDSDTMGFSTADLVAHSVDTSDPVKLALQALIAHPPRPRGILCVLKYKDMVVAALEAGHTKKQVAKTLSATSGVHVADHHITDTLKLEGLAKASRGD